MPCSADAGALSQQATSVTASSPAGYVVMHDHGVVEVLGSIAPRTVAMPSRNAKRLGESGSNASSKSQDRRGDSRARITSK
jgi:hypothetical protein